LRHFRLKSARRPADVDSVGWFDRRPDPGRIQDLEQELERQDERLVRIDSARTPEELSRALRQDPGNPDRDEQVAIVVGAGLATLVAVIAVLIGWHVLGSDTPSRADGRHSTIPTLHPATRPTLITVRPDGSDESLFTGAGAAVWSYMGDWSPDGARIVFGSSGQALKISRADGTDARPLAAATGGEVGPSWSPDGARLAYGRDGDIYVDRVDDRVAGTPVLAGPADEGSPDWSPDGKRLVYVKDGFVHIARADGTHVAALTDGPYSDVFPAWSPDGARITFTSADNGSWDVYTMRPDGSDIRRLTDETASDGYSTWSPDGKRIAFASDRDGEWDIYVMNADGSEVRQVTHSPHHDRAPVWSPDGRRILFERDLATYTP
jgi:TolB protein